MLYLCLEELSELFDDTPLWSATGPAPGRFKRADFLGYPKIPLEAEVNNTPWDERHSYVLDGPRNRGWLHTQFDKRFHVSPFNPMEMRYHWRSNTPERKLILHMENTSDGDKVFDATLSLSAQPLNAKNLNRHLLRYPFMTIKVGLSIYWQALRLYFKGVPVHSHPGNQKAIGAHHE